jgi:hypothetical protein
MNLLEIIKATLIELDRGTADDTVAMYKEKFTMYANEAVNEIVRRFKLVNVDPIVTNSGSDPSGFAYFSAEDLNYPAKRIVRVLPAAFGTPANPGDDPPIVATPETLMKPLPFASQILGGSFISIFDKERVKPGDPVFVEYRRVPEPMNVSSLTPVGTPPVVTPDTPDIPEIFHPLIPLYVRAREQCGQDPSTQGTSSAYFSLFNQAVYNLQRETLGTPNSFALWNYHFE